MRIDNFYPLKDLTLIEYQFSQISDGEMFTSLGEIWESYQLKGSMRYHPVRASRQY